jgi:hypothetical protein
VRMPSATVVAAYQRATSLNNSGRSLTRSSLQVDEEDVTGAGRPPTAWTGLVAEGGFEPPTKGL